jgi:hypothetical protein
MRSSPSARGRASPTVKSGAVASNKMCSWIPCSQRACHAVIVALAFVCFGASYDGAYVFDDWESVVNNGDTKCNQLWDVVDTRLFAHDFWGQPIASQDSHKSYRPLTVLSFRFVQFHVPQAQLREF